MLAEELDRREKLQLEEAFIGAFYGGNKGGLGGRAQRGKGTKIIARADHHSLPLAVSIESASPHQSQLVEGLLGHSFFLDDLPGRLIGTNLRQ